MLGQVHLPDRWRRAIIDWGKKKVHFLVRGTQPPETAFEVSGENFMVVVINQTVAYPALFVNGSFGAEASSFIVDGAKFAATHMTDIKRHGVHSEMPGHYSAYGLRVSYTAPGDVGEFLPAKCTFMRRDVHRGSSLRALRGRAHTSEGARQAL